MSKVIDMEGIKRGDAHLEKAKEIDPQVTAREVPLEAIDGEISQKQTFSIDEISRIIGMHPITVRRAIKAGDLKAAHGGGKGAYRISKPELEAWWKNRGGGKLF